MRARRGADGTRGGARLAQDLVDGPRGNLPLKRLSLQRLSLQRSSLQLPNGQTIAVLPSGQSLEERRRSWARGGGRGARGGRGGARGREGGGALGAILGMGETLMFFFPLQLTCAIGAVSEPRPRMGCGEWGGIYKSSFIKRGHNGSEAHPDAVFVRKHHLADRRVEPAQRGRYV